MLKNTTKIMIGILSIIVISLVSLLVYVLAFDGEISFVTNQFETKLINTQIIQIEDINTITIDGYGSDIIFLQGDEGEIVIKEYAVQIKTETFVDATKNNQELSLKVNQKAFPSILVFGSNYHYMEVYVPASYQGTLDIETHSGEVESKVNLELTDCKINTSSGDIDLKTVKANNIELTVSSGEIDADVLEANSVTLTASSGDIEVKQILGNTEIATKSGEIDIHGGLGESKITSTSGDIMIENLEGKKNIQSTSGYIYVERSVGDIKASSNSGNIEMDIIVGSLELKTTSGEVQAINIQGKATVVTSSGGVEMQFIKLDGDMNVTTKSGDIDCEIPKELAFTLIINTTSGDIDTNYDHRVIFDKNRTSGEGVIGDNPQLTINLKTGSGDIYVSE